MCTAITYKTDDHYFGRNLDLEISYNEKVTVTPRKFPLKFRKLPALNTHYAMIGMAAVFENYPLYYDATNEKGLSMAGLNFPENADYKPYDENKLNVTPFEFIPWILGQCKSVVEAKKLLLKTNLVSISFSDNLPLSPLHWIVADKNTSVTVEQTLYSLSVYENPIGVLTNNPTFDIQLFNLNNYMNLSNKEPLNKFLKTGPVTLYSRGMGALGLPGDFSSMSRFIKAAFVKSNSCSGKSESESISQFFHILYSVAHPRGSVLLNNDKYEITIYTSCCNTDKGIYYYTTYENNQITGIDMHKENLDSNSLICYPLIQSQQIKMQN